MKTVLQSKSGKRVAFAPNQVDYMTAHGWRRPVELPTASKRKSKSDTIENPKPAEAES